MGRSLYCATTSPKEPCSVNRPTPVKTDNFFLLIFRALRHRRVPIALRIASHNVILVALALVIYAGVMGLQFKQAMHEQADALGQALTTQTATSATELLVSNDILSLNVLLGNLVKNPLVAHAAIYSVDNRILAEAGQRPKNGLLGEAQGLYEIKITFQDVMAGHLRISLDMSQFQQPMTISLQSMGILAGILLALALALSLRLGRHISTPLMQMRIWLRDIDPYTPATDRQDEIGDLARQLRTSFAPPVPEPEPLPEPEYDGDEDDGDDPYLEPEERPAPPVSARTSEPKPRLPAPPVQRRIVAEEDEDDDEDPFADLRDSSNTAPAARPVAAPVAPVEPHNSAVLAVQLGAQDQLRRLPRARLTELLQRYRDCLDQAASLYESELHTLNDGSTLMLFHSHESGDDYLTNAICCGELLRALSHALQIEVADSGITLQLQLGLTLGEGLSGLSQIDLLLTETAQDALALSQHSRNLLLVERRINDDPLIRQRARIRPIASPEGACCVERLMEPYPSMLERQLARMHESNKA
nr:histidine kinase [Pseudomonas savastanoi]